MTAADTASATGFGDRAASLPPLAVIVGRAEWPRDKPHLHGIRFTVFVDEQQVPYAEEIDDYDDPAIHFLAYLASTGEPIGTARLIPKGDVAKIGRVAVLRPYRGQGVGLALMRSVLQHAAQAGFAEAVLDSQSYAIPFYDRMGFVREGDEFMDGGIPHYRMRLALAASESVAADAGGMQAGVGESAAS